jgi:hypothetical protein
LELIDEACSGKDGGGDERGEESGSECDIFALLFGVVKDDSVVCRVDLGVSSEGETSVG